MRFQDLKQRIQTDVEPKRIAIALAEGDETFKALGEAVSQHLCHPVLVGEKSLISQKAEAYGLKKFDLIQADNPEAAAGLAIQAVKEGKADLLMKGNVATSTLLKAVLKDKGGLRRDRLLSHVLVIEKPDGKFLGITDGGLNISPGLKEKRAIIENAVELFQILDIRVPRIAALSAVEFVNPDIPTTLEAAQLSKMAERNQIKDAIVDGPLGLDLAVSPTACRLKGITSPLNGEADILLAPDLVSGNLLGKSLMYIAGFPSGGLVVGAACPIILLSRSDSAGQRLNSIILGVAYVQYSGH